MSGESFYESDLYNELRELTHKLEQWYDIDKIKWYSVYVWTKGTNGENVFDIWPDDILFFNEDHVIPAEAIPVIQEIQEKLKEINEYLS